MVNFLECLCFSRNNANVVNVIETWVMRRTDYHQTFITGQSSTVAFAYISQVSHWEKGKNALTMPMTWHSMMVFRYSLSKCSLSLALSLRYDDKVVV